MKILIITVAGMSTRFSQSLKKDCLKCIYYKTDIKESLLYRMISNNLNFDKYIIVGGYMYEHLKSVVENDFSQYLDKIILVNNEQYAEYGSGYSLYKGLKAAMEFDFDEIVFAEGDLYVDVQSFEKIYGSPHNVITINKEPIYADKSVAFYLDTNDTIHYIYSTEHSELEIGEPFKAVFNSGQIWKFVNAERLKTVYKAIEYEEWQGTNLVFVQRYFQTIPSDEYDIIQFKNWVNCNTITDFDNYLKICENARH